MAFSAQRVRVRLVATTLIGAGLAAIGLAGGGVGIATVVCA